VIPVDIGANHVFFFRNHAWTILQSSSTVSFAVSGILKSDRVLFQSALPNVVLGIPSSEHHAELA